MLKIANEDEDIEEDQDEDVEEDQDEDVEEDEDEDVEEDEDEIEEADLDIPLDTAGPDGLRVIVVTASPACIIRLSPASRRMKKSWHSEGPRSSNNHRYRCRV